MCPNMVNTTGYIMCGAASVGSACTATCDDGYTGAATAYDCSLNGTAPTWVPRGQVATCTLMYVGPRTPILIRNIMANLPCLLVQHLPASGEPDWV